MRHFKGPKIFKAVAVTLALGLSATLVACGSSADSSVKSQTFSFVAPGGKTLITYDQGDRKPIAKFQGESLMEPGSIISLDQFDGEVVVLNAWGQWCAPCRTEVDDLEEVQEAIAPKGGTVLGINVRDNSAEVARDFVKDNGLTYPSIYDPPFQTAAALGGVPASVIPTTIVLDRQHRVAAVFLREITAKELLEVVNPLLDEPVGT